MAQSKHVGVILPCDDHAVLNAEEDAAWLNVATAPEIVCGSEVTTEHASKQEHDEPLNVDLEWITEVRRGFGLLTEAETAVLLKVSKRTLQSWHQAGEGPARVKAGNFIAYRLNDLREWLDCSVQPSFKK
ncbi:MAG: helix-turn-helix domain-containing protein [Alphaproteobacteria bacterium]|nr:helix-turn-helix domain-containing protein [Alphaproteobacteria bacterium]